MTKAISALLDRLANTRARDIAVEFMHDGYICDRDGLPASLAEELDGELHTAVYATCAACGKPQIP